MSRWKNFSYDHRRIYLLLKVLGVVIISILVLGIVGSGLLRFVFIPLEIQSYHPLYGKEKIGSLIVQKQQILNPKLLAQLTYINANGQKQTANDEQYGNGVILEGASLGLPGFGVPGGESGIKLVGMDIQQINTASTANDPPVLSNNAKPLNGGKDGFFSYAQKTQLPLVQATSQTYQIGPISGSAAYCYNIYATLEPTFALSAEPAPGPCNSPFTRPLP